MRYWRTRSRWSPWSIINPALDVPPQAQKALSLCAMSARSVVFSSIPSITVVGLPNFLVSRRMRMRCCSFSISPQTQRSFGSPHVVQTSAMTVSPLGLVTEIYKSFKADGGFGWGVLGVFCKLVAVCAILLFLVCSLLLGAVYTPLLYSFHVPPAGLVLRLSALRRLSPLYLLIQPLGRNPVWRQIFWDLLLAETYPPPHIKPETQVQFPLDGLLHWHSE